jgi:hypothetical protein
MKKPDNIADNPNLLPYGSNVGAPSIKPDNIDSWKVINVVKVNKHFKTRYDELNLEFQKLVEEYDWNQIVYSAKFSFEPIIGEVYHLYSKLNGDMFLSLINPSEWKQEYVASFKLDSNNKWIKYNLNK